MCKQKKFHVGAEEEDKRQGRKELWERENQSKDQTREGKHEPGYEYGKIHC